MSETSKFRFSAIHPTARTKPPYPSFPTGWRESYDAWLKMCSDPSRVQYILVVHGDNWEDFWERNRGLLVLAGMAKRYNPQTVSFRLKGSGWGEFLVVRNDGANTGVSQGNRGCEFATGEILCGNMDDLFPPEGWDDKISLSIMDTSAEKVLHVSTGSPQDEALFVPQIQTLVRYKRLGYGGWREYESMFVDDEFTAHAKLDGCVVDGRHIRFEHRHPSMGTAELDDVYSSENRREAYVLGQRLFERRRAAGFPPHPVPEAIDGGRKHRTLAVCTPGETFSALWVWHFFELWCGAAAASIGFAPFQGYCTNPYVTRTNMRRDVLACPVPIDYVLWIDDDQLVEWPQVERLIEDLEQHPEAAAVAGWTWIQGDIGDMFTRSSVGHWAKGFVSLPASSLRGSDLIEIDVTGFPCLLMRRELLEAAGDGCFFPERADMAAGIVGEDSAFCLNARRLGARFFVDPQVYVPHLKLRPITPPAAIAAVDAA